MQKNEMQLTQMSKIDFVSFHNFPSELKEVQSINDGKKKMCIINYNNSNNCNCNYSSSLNKKEGDKKLLMLGSNKNISYSCGNIRKIILNKNKDILLENPIKKMQFGVIFNIRRNSKRK